MSTSKQVMLAVAVAFIGTVIFNVGKEEIKDRTNIRNYMEENFSTTGFEVIKLEDSLFEVVTENKIYRVYLNNKNEVVGATLVGDILK